MRIDRASRRIKAPADRIYRALTDREAVQSWLPPAGARGEIEAFDPTPGGAFRMTLVFDTAGDTGRRKSSANTDVVDGEFLRLVPERLVQQRFTFRSADPAFAGAMVMTWSLTAVNGATEVEVSAEGVPPGISPDDHTRGMASSLENLAHYVRG
ncbi:MAG: SRPBCC domain-containing protein [Pseudomonadota bacterium]